MASVTEIEKVDELIELLNSTPVLTSAEIKRRADAFHKSFRVDEVGLCREGLSVEAAIVAGRTDLVPESARLMLQEGLTYGEALARRTDITPLPDADVATGRDYDAHLNSLKCTDQDLGFQCDYVHASIMRHMETGEPIAPNFVWRIAVLLRRAKHEQRELRFLRAWCGRYGEYEMLGTRERKLEERLRKLKQTLEKKRVAESGGS